VTFLNKDPKSLPEFPLTFRIGLIETIVLGIQILFLAGVGIWFYLHDVKFVGLLIIAYGIYRGLYFGKIYVRLTDEDILYFNSFNPFSKPKKMSWKNIQRAETGIKVTSFSTRYFTRLYEKENGRLMEINIKWFSKENVRLLGVAFQEKAKQAELDEATKDLARGYVPSFVLGKAKPWF